MFFIKNVSWTGLSATMYEQIGYNVADIVAKVIWAIAVKSPGSRRIVPGPSFSDSAVGDMTLWVNSPYAQLSAVCNALSFGITATGLPRSCSGSRFRT